MLRELLAFRQLQLCGQLQTRIRRAGAVEEQLAKPSRHVILSPH
ncbi:hypothetical protein [Lelliottia amnigena]|jgi:hypothetical protein|nr:hypothetical protein [Lelliottia amnigena]